MGRLLACTAGWLVVGLLALAAISAPASASCAGPGAVRWRGVSYLANFAVFDRLPAAGRTLDGGVEPGCNDTVPPSSTASDVPVALRALKGVPPRIAVVRSSDPTTALLSDGFLLGLKSHPLHRYARLGKPSRLFGCERTSVVRGSTRTASFPSFVIVATAEGDVKVVVRAGTKMRVPRKAGMPYVPANAPLSIRGCLSKDGTRIAADAIRTSS